MPLLALLRAESTLDARRLVLMAVVAGLSNAMVLAVINAAAGRGPNDAGGFRLAMLFVIVLVLYTISQRFILTESAREVEKILNRVRTRLIEAVRHCELPEIERIGRSRIYDGVSNEIQRLAESTNILVVMGQMLVLVVFTTFYLMTLSMTSFILAVTFMGIAITIYLQRNKELQRALDDAGRAENRLHELLIGVIDGFKEIKLNARRSDALAADVEIASAAAAEERVKAKVGYASSFVFTQNVFFLLLGTMVFIVPALSHSYGSVVVETTTAVLFVFGPISGIVSAVPILAGANASAGSIMALERELGERNGAAPAVATTTVHSNGVAFPSFRTISLRGVSFSYRDRDDHPFSVGPIDLDLHAGETLFISGGNGSGKSTFLRLLTALYWPQAGTITVDGTLVTRENADAYRSLFSSVFSDYHLFRRLYGIEAAELAEVPELLTRFEVADKTHLDDDAFSTIGLSDGQRKRLALIVAMLEHRPICILDEWAADQDPVFRGTFYTELLGVLKARGMTIVAVSHDDRYYDRGDRRLHMDEGRLASVTPEDARV